MPFDNSWQAVMNPGLGSDYFDCAARPDLQPCGSTFDTATAWWLAELSRLIYRVDSAAAGSRHAGDPLNAVLETVGLVAETTIAQNGLACAVVRPRRPAETSFTIVVFRGTQAPKNWFYNLDAIHTVRPDGIRTHRGFQAAFDSIWPSVSAAIGSGDPGGRVYTGHSLGAALATLAAAACPPLAVYTFGSPRVGDASLVRSFGDTPIFRVVNGGDIVPHLPLKSELIDFRHVGTLVHVNSGGAVATDTARDEETDWRTFSKTLQSVAFTITHPPPILVDHAPINYVTALQRRLGGS